MPNRGGGAFAACVRPQSAWFDGAEYVQGDVNDPDALAAAAEGVDALVYMAMGDPNSGGIARRRGLREAATSTST